MKLLIAIIVLYTAHCIEGEDTYLGNDSPNFGLWAKLEPVDPFDTCSDVYQNDYRGTIAVTRSGKTCEDWTDEDKEKFPWAGRVKNYCRNNRISSGGSDKAYCRTEQGTEKCNVPRCNGYDETILQSFHIECEGASSECSSWSQLYTATTTSQIVCQKRVLKNTDRTRMLFWNGENWNAKLADSTDSGLECGSIGDITSTNNEEHLENTTWNGFEIDEVCIVFDITETMATVGEIKPEVGGYVKVGETLTATDRIKNWQLKSNDLSSKNLTAECQHGGQFDYNTASWGGTVNWNPTRIGSAHLWFNSHPSGPASTTLNITNTLRITDSCPCTYFVALGYASGYFGIATSNSRPVVIFSQWGGVDAETVDAGDGVNCNHFSHEGKGVTATLSFPQYKLNTNLTFLLEGWIKDGYYYVSASLEYEGKTYFIGTHRRLSRSWTRSYYSFVENYCLAVSFLTKRRVEYYNTSAVIDGEWKDIKTFTFYKSCRKDLTTVGKYTGGVTADGKGVYLSIGAPAGELSPVCKGCGVFRRHV